MFTGFFVLLFIGVNVGNLLLYTFFSKALVSEINTGNMNMLTKIKNATELMYEEIHALSTQLGHGNITITKIMFENERDRLLEYQGHQILQSTLVSYPYIDYLAVYNERLDELIGTRYFTIASEEALKELARNSYQQGGGGGIQFTIPLAVEPQGPSQNNPARNTITLIIYSPLSLEDDKGVLLAGINCDYFQQLISKMDEGNLETVMILHGNAQVISHPDVSQLLMDYSGREFVTDIISGGSGSGYFIREIDTVETFVSYTKSGVLDWVFINMVPYNKIMSRLLFLRNLTLIITLIVLCAGVVISYLLALRMYQPIRQILKRLNYNQAPERIMGGHEDLYIEKQLEYLHSAAQLSESVVRGTIVIDLIKNQYIDNEIINSQVIETVFKHPYYMICIFSYDKQEAFEKLNTGGQGDMRNRLIKIVEELMKKVSPSADYAVISPTDVACLLHLDTGAIPEQMGLLMAETGEMVKKFNNLTISAAAGSIVNSIFVINDSFEEAREILKERFFSGAETYIIRKRGTFTPTGFGGISRISESVRGETQFPERIMVELNNAVISGAAKQITDAVGKLSAELEKTSYEYAHMHLNTAVMQLLSFCLVNKLPVDANSFHAINSRIQGLETLQKACEILREFCFSLVSSISKNPEETLPPIVRDAVKLAAEKYGNPAFSINTAAAIFNITPAYSP
jgi:hypothetical protein